MAHRIIKNVKYNQYSEKVDEYYHVQRQKSFLGIKYWSYYTHIDMGIHKFRTQFKTLQDAYNFCERVNNVASPNELKKEVYTKNK